MPLWISSSAFLNYLCALMKNAIQLHDKKFVVSLPSTKIQERIKTLGSQISSEMEGKCPLFICVLNGAFLFAADLLKNISIDCEITFIRVSSYEGTASTGNLKSIMGLSENIEGRSVIIVEDIVDTGHTMVHLINELKSKNPAQLKLASLLLKPAALQHDIKIDYTGFEVPNDFLVGYGLDYDGLGRNLSDIYTLSID